MLSWKNWLAPRVDDPAATEPRTGNEKVMLNGLLAST